jgi:phage tail sheath protein FI
MSHGVSISEVPTGVVPPVHVDAGLAVYVGTAPINDGDLTAVNKPVLVSTLAEFVASFGPLVPSSAWGDWTLHEAAKAHFSAYGVGPIVCINVIDPENADHKASVVTEPLVLDADGNATIDVYGSTTGLYGVLKSTVVVKLAGVTKTLGTDYTLAFDDDGFLVVSRVSSGTIPALSHITVTCDYLDPSGIVADDIIGGYSAGEYTGLAVVEQVYPKLRLVPGFVLAPKWSQTPAVAAAVKTAARTIDGNFRAMGLVDLSTDSGEIASYADAAAWKTDNGYSLVDLIVCWPLFKNGDDVYHLSTIVACVANLTDADHDGIPYASPSNKVATGTSAVLDDGTEVLLTGPQANALNDQGIVTARNGFAGWKVWGNRTGGYPGTTDPKDSFIPIRRMFNWIGNTIILTTDRDVDEPGNKRLIQGVVGTIGSFLNSLVAAGALIAGKIEFRKDENPVTNLADGKIKFHDTLTPPSPAEDIEDVLEYDPAALAGLFA